MTDLIRKQKDTHLHRIMGKGYEQVIQKEKMVMAFKNYEIPPIKLSSIKNKLHYPMLSHIWGSEQLHILLVEKLIQPFHKLTVSLLWKTFLRILIFFLNSKSTLKDCNKNQYGYTQIFYFKYFHC